MLENFEGLSANAIEGNEMKEKVVQVMVCPHASESALTNWIANEILVVYSLSQ